MQENYNIVVGRNKYGEIYVLKYVFEHDISGADKFKGAVGSEFVAITKGIYREQRSKFEVVNKILDTSDVDGDSTMTKKEAIKIYQNMKNNGELDEWCFDLSYYYMHDAIREAFNLSEKEYPIIECIGGGRCFDKETLDNLVEVVCDQKIIDLIKKYEDIK